MKILIAEGMNEKALRKIKSVFEVHSQTETCRCGQIAVWNFIYGDDITILDLLRLVGIITEATGCGILFNKPIDGLIPDDAVLLLSAAKDLCDDM